MVWRKCNYWSLNIYDVVNASRGIERIAVTATAPSDAGVRVTRTFRENTNIPQINCWIVPVAT